MEVKHEILKGVSVNVFENFDHLLSYIEGYKGILVAINAEKIINATDETRSIINRNIGYCDGAGAVAALKRRGYKNVARIPGCELWLKIIEATYQKGHKFYFVGSTTEVINATVSKLKVDFPGINIVGYRNGFMNDEERTALIADIAEKKPDAVFVAMGSPRQELLMEEMFKEHPAVYQGLGGSFDVYTGNKQRAPRWWQEHNLEWAYRLLHERARFNRYSHYLRYAILLYTGRL